MIRSVHMHSFFDTTDRVERALLWKPGMTARDAVPENVRGSETLVVTVNGEKVPPDTSLRDGAVVTSVVLPGEPGSLTLAQLIFLQVASYAVISIFTPALPTKRRGDETSPVYGFGGIQNNRTEGEPIPIVLGRHRVGGQVISEFVESKGALGAFYNTILCFGYGVFESIAGIYADTDPAQPRRSRGVGDLAIPRGLLTINDTDVNDYHDVEVHVRLGTIEQEPIVGFERDAEIVSVEQDLTAPDANSNSAIEYFISATTPSTSEDSLWATYGVPNTLNTRDFDAFTVTIEMQNGIGSIGSTGDFTAWSAAWAVRYIELDSGGIPITTGGPDGDGYVRLRPVPLFTGRIQGGFTVDYTFPTYNPQTYTAPAQGQLLSVNFEGSFAEVWLDKSTPSVPAVWSTNALLDEFSVETWVVLRPNGSSTGSTSSVTDAMNVIDNPVFDWIDRSLLRGFGLVIGTRTFTLSPGQTRTRIVPILLVGTNGALREYYERNPAGTTTGVASQVGDCVFRHTVHGANDAPTIDYAHLVVTYKASAVGGLDRVRVYANGELLIEVVAAIGARAPAAATVPFILCRNGSSNSTNQIYFKGYLDELIVRHKELTPSEVEATFATGFGVSHPSSSDIVAGYHFDSPSLIGNGITVPDFGPASNSLTGHVLLAAGDRLRSGNLNSVVCFKTVPTNTIKRSKYKVEVMRATRNVTQTNRLDESRLRSITTHLDDVHSYPEMALLALRMPAQDQASGSAPTIKVVVEGMVIDVWDGVESPQPSFIRRHSRNPAWLALFYARSKMLSLGNYFPRVRDIDLVSARELADRCDEPVYDQQRSRLARSLTTGWIDMLYGTTLDGGAPGIEVRVTKGRIPSSWLVGRFLGWYGVPTQAGGYVDHNFAATGPGGYRIVSIDTTPGGWDAVLVSWNRADEGNGHPWAAGLLSTATGVTPTGTVEGREERFVCDLVIDTEESAWEKLVQILATAHAAPLLVGRRLKFIFDAPRPASLIVGNGNIVEDSFEWGYGSPRTRENELQIQFFDEALGWERSMVPVPDPSLQDQTSLVQLRSKAEFVPGITRRSQAYRHGRYKLNLNRYVTQEGRLETSIDTLPAEPSDVVRVAHHVVPRGTSGRVHAVDTDASVLLGAEVVLEPGETYFLAVQSASAAPGTVFETREVTSAAGTYRGWLAESLTLASAFSFTPQRDDLFVLCKQGDELEMQVNAVGLTQDLRRELVLSRYDARVFDVEGQADLPDVPVQALQAGDAGADDGSRTDDVAPLNVGEPKAAEVAPRRRGGGSQAQILVSWKHDPTSVARVGSTVVYLARDQGPFEEAVTVPGAVQSAAIALPSHEVGARWRLAIQPRTARGARRAPEMCTVIGCRTYSQGPAPAGPSSIQTSMQGDRATYLVVGGGDVEGSSYELRRGGWVLGQAIDVIPAGAASLSTTQDYVTVIASSAGPASAKVLARARSASGRFSSAVVVESILMAEGATNLVDVKGVDGFFDQAWEDYAGDGTWGGPWLSIPGVAVSDLQEVDGVLRFDGSATTGELITQEPFSLMGAAGALLERVHVSAYLEADQVHPLTWDEAVWAWDNPEADQWTWEGPIAPIGDAEDPGQCTATIEVRYFDEAYQPGEWQAYRPTIVRCTAAQFRVTVTRPNDGFDVRLRRLVTVVRRMPDLRFEASPARRLLTSMIRGET